MGDNRTCILCAGVPPALSVGAIQANRQKPKEYLNMRSGIYMITCIITDKSYIGKTIGNIRQRVMYHLNGNTPGCAALHSAIKKYKKENFTWQVLHEDVIPELLSMFEMEAIKTHNTVSPNGYNLTAGGETGFQSEETIRKRTETLRANPPMKGKKHTPEACRKMSESRTGSKRSPETRKRMSNPPQVTKFLMKPR